MDDEIRSLLIAGMDESAITMEIYSMLEEERSQLQRMTNELQAQVDVLKQLTEQQQKQLDRLEKHSNMQARVDIFEKLTRQQQEHISLLEKQNDSQKKQVKALMEEIQASRTQLKPSYLAVPLPSFSRRSKSQHRVWGAQHTKTSSDQQNNASKRSRFSPPAITIVAVLIVILIGSSGAYGTATGHLPWFQSTAHTPSHPLSSTATMAVPPGAHVPITTTSSGRPQLTIPGQFTISGGVGTSAFFWSSEGTCHGDGLATNRLTYTTDELQEMYNYFTGGLTHTRPRPKTLTAVDGATTTTSSSLVLPQFQNCPTGWELTNIGQSPLQFVQLRMKLLADTATTNAHYRLVDFCSVLFGLNPTVNNGPCPGLGGSVEPISLTFPLGAGKAGTFITGQPTAQEQTINPGTTIFLQLGFLPADLSAALTYTIEPEFVLNTSQGNNKVFDLPQWKETFVMAPANHFGCYQLHGKTFVAATRGAFCF